MSTLLDLIQTKVNYVVQEAIVVIKDIFRKYPNKYVPVPPSEAAATLWEGKARRSLSPLPYFWATNSILKRNTCFFLISPLLPLLCSSDQNN